VLPYRFAQQWLPLASGVLVLGLAAAPVFAQTSPVPTPSGAAGISVLGEGVVLAQPNTARVTLGTDVFMPTLAAAQAEASTRMDAVVQKLKASGIPDSDIRTVSFSISPQYDTRDQNQPTLRGYQVQNLVEARSQDVGGLGQLIDDVVSAGATRVVGITFEASDMQGLKDQARDQAMQNARAKAEQLARGSGVSLGRPMLVEESDTGGVTPVRAQPAAAQAGVAAAPPPPVQPGELQVRTTVRVVWAIQ
jgi:uncharacterized protein YggE